MEVLTTNPIRIPNVLFASMIISISLVLFAGCANQDASSKVIDGKTTAAGNPNCSAMSIPNQYNVKWKSGELTTINVQSREDLVQNFVTPNINEIDFVEPDFKIKAVSAEIVTEAVANPSADNWGQDKVGASTAWTSNIRGDGVIVGVVDSGVDITHPQIKPQLSINTGEIPDNGIDDDKNGYIDDYYTFDFYSNQPGVVNVDDHGTHVSGIILADHSSGPIQGIAPGAKLVPANFMSNGGGNLGNAINAMHYVVSRGAKVINASWGGVPCTQSLQTLQTAFAELEAKGVMVVVAAGNDGLNLDQSPDFPAAFNLPGQITVAASTPNDMLAGFSDFGPNYVHVAAPGFDIWSTVKGGLYAQMRGTSMAAPFVTGVVALLIGHKPTATVKQIKQAIMGSVDPENYPIASKGRINIARAIQKIDALVP